MKKRILFVILEQFADWEAAYLSSAIYMLGQNNYEVKTISLKKEAVQSIGGFRVIPDYEALILIGGLTWRKQNAREVAPLAESAYKAGKILGAICDASAFLGTIGLLNYGNHTSNDLKDLKQWAGASYTGESRYLRQQAVSDKNIVTANGTAALEFAKEVMLTLKLAPEKKINEWYQFHKLGYYGAPMPEM